MVQLAPTARVVPHELAKTNCVASAPVTAILEMVSAAVPVLVMVIICEPLDSPWMVGAKLSALAERVTGGSRPVPVSAIVCGELSALSVIVMSAVNAPAAIGAKCPWMVQLAPVAKVIPQEFPKT